MKTIVSGKNVEISGGLGDWLNKKIEKLDKYLSDNIEVQVKLFSQVKQSSNVAEITIPLGGNILRVKETGADMYTCIDKAVDKIIRQIRRHRTKLDKQRLRAGAFEPEMDVAEVVVDDEPLHQLVRVKRFALKPMAVEDAIAQMEMLGHSFFLFLNDETQGACVVYRRDDGDYGLLSPENA